MAVTMVPSPVKAKVVVEISAVPGSLTWFYLLADSLALFPRRGPVCPLPCLVSRQSVCVCVCSRIREESAPSPCSKWTFDLLQKPSASAAASRTSGCFPMSGLQAYLCGHIRSLDCDRMQPPPMGPSPGG